MTIDVCNDCNFTEYDPAQIVVDLPYHHLALKLLGEIGGRGDDQATIIDFDEALGLGLIQLNDVTGLAERIRAQPPRDDDPPARIHSALDVVLHELRHRFRTVCRTWVPEMGKNRAVYGVQASPHIGTGGSAYPAKAEGPDALTLPADRSIGRGVRIGLIDTKIYPAESINGRYLALQDSMFSEEQREFSHLAGHGTFSAGRILASAPGAEVIVRGVLDDMDGKSTVWAVATAMMEFAGRRVDVLVLPLACYTCDGQPPLALQRAIDRVRDNTVVTTAAGNHGNATEVDGGFSLRGRPTFPAACSGAVAVGATGLAPGTLAPFSPKLPWVQLVAPGEDVPSTFVSGWVKFLDMQGPEDVPKPDVFGGDAIWGGTSFSAAMIGGEIAARMTAKGLSAYEVLDELRLQDPEHHLGIGRYQGWGEPPEE